MADERTERQQREDEAEAALASAGAAAAPAAGEQGDAPAEARPEEGAPVEGEVPPGEEAAAGEPTEHAEAVEAAAGEPTEHAEAVEATLDDPTPQDDTAAQYLALAQRTQADFENFRRRATRERGEAEARGVAKLARELLPALDNLERALAAAEAQDHDQHLTQGIRLVQGELVAALQRAGIEAYTPKGEPFDPTVHEAMAQHPVEGTPSGTVVEVYQQGYRLADTVLRPARVVVAA